MHLLTSMRYTQKIMHVHMIRHELKMYIGKKILKHNQFIYYFRVRYPCLKLSICGTGSTGPVQSPQNVAAYLN